MVDGVWIDELGRVKNEFHNFYKTLFSKKIGTCSSTKPALFHTLSEDLVKFLQAPFSNEEIKSAV